jgi:hypothetical protein
MAATPEGRVKRRVRRLLDRYEGLYQFWPVQSGLGATTLDVLGCYRGRFFAVETKAAGKALTPRQETTAAQMVAADAKVFVVVGEDSPVLFEMKTWLDALGRVSS